MLKILREYLEDDMQVTEYTGNGTTVSHTVRSSAASERVPVESLEQVKASKQKALQGAYYASFTTFKSDALGEEKTYPIDAEAHNNLKDYQARLIADPSKDAVYFKTIEDGNLILHNRAQFLQLMEDAEMFKVNQTIKINE